MIVKKIFRPHLAGAFLLIPFLSPVEGSAYEITSCRGSCSIENGIKNGHATWHAVTAGEKFGQRKMARTDANSTLVITFKDKSSLTLFANTRAVITPKRIAKFSAHSLFLLAGRVVAKVMKNDNNATTQRKKHRMTVTTTTLAMGIRGTVVDVGVATNGETQAVVYNGQVDASDEYYQKFNLNDKEGLTTGGKKTHKQHHGQHYEQWQRWQQQGHDDAKRRSGQILKKTFRRLTSLNFIMRHQLRQHLDANRRIKKITSEARAAHKKGDIKTFRTLSKQGYKQSFSAHQQFRTISHLKVKARAMVYSIRNLARRFPGSDPQMVTLEPRLKKLFAGLDGLLTVY